jgi:hypothetical protein
MKQNVLQLPIKYVGNKTAEITVNGSVATF